MIWPQVVVIIILCIELGLSLLLHGEKKHVDRHNFIDSFIEVAILFWLLWMGNFFNGIF